MRVSFFGEAAELPVKYFLLSETMGDSLEHYGLRAELYNESVEILRITPLQPEILSLLDMLQRYSVTPVSVPDVVYDWLLR